MSADPGRPAETPSTEPISTEDAAALRTELEHARGREDELLRAVAELTNVNRRRKQEMENVVLYAQESLVRSLLPVLDDLDRALETSKDRERDAVRAGVHLIRERLRRILEKEGLEEIPALGRVFDPELHEAVGQRSSTDCATGTVLEVVLAGYRLRGRILRHAQVIVASPAVHEGAARGSAGRAGESDS